MVQWLSVVCLIILAVGLAEGDAAQKEPWPQQVVENLWIPDSAQIDKEYHEGSYTFEYTANVCYPAKSLIGELAKTMASKGWKRLDRDPFNPSVPLNHTIGEWNRVLDKGGRARYGWVEFWADNENNIAEYRFQYQPREGPVIASTDCALRGFSSYLPKAMVDAMLKKIKEIEQEMTEGKGAPR